MADQEQERMNIEWNSREEWDRYRMEQEEQDSQTGIIILIVFLVVAGVVTIASHQKKEK